MVELLKGVFVPLHNMNSKLKLDINQQQTGLGRKVWHKFINNTTKIQAQKRLMRKVRHAPKYPLVNAEQGKKRFYAKYNFYNPYSYYNPYCMQKHRIIKETASSYYSFYCGRYYAGEMH